MQSDLSFHCPREASLDDSYSRGTAPRIERRVSRDDWAGLGTLQGTFELEHAKVQLHPVLRHYPLLGVYVQTTTVYTLRQRCRFKVCASCHFLVRDYSPANANKKKSIVITFG